MVETENILGIIAMFRVHENRLPGTVFQFGGDHQIGDAALLVERIAAQPAFLTVEDVARDAGATARKVQRRFADHVGISPKAVIRRYRLYEAAERARGGGRVDWAEVAASLGYWRAQLADLPVLELATALPRPAERGYRGAPSTDEGGAGRLRRSVTRTGLVGRSADIGCGAARGWRSCRVGPAPS